jgi:hypothetical protein
MGNHAGVQLAARVMCATRGKYGRALPADVDAPAYLVTFDSITREGMLSPS